MLLMQYLVARQLRRERVFRDRTNPFEYNDDELLSKYRYAVKQAPASVTCQSGLQALQDSRDMATSENLFLGTPSCSF